LHVRRAESWSSKRKGGVLKDASPAAAPSEGCRPDQGLLPGRASANLATGRGARTLVARRRMTNRPRGTAGCYRTDNRRRLLAAPNEETATLRQQKRLLATGGWLERCWLQSMAGPERWARQLARTLRPRSRPRTEDGRHRSLVRWIGRISHAAVQRFTTPAGRASSSRDVERLPRLAGPGHFRVIQSRGRSLDGLVRRWAHERGQTQPRDSGVVQTDSDDRMGPAASTVLRSTEPPS